MQDLISHRRPTSLSHHHYHSTPHYSFPSPAPAPPCWSLTHWRRAFEANALHQFSCVLEEDTHRDGRRLTVKHLATKRSRQTSRYVDESLSLIV